MLPPAPLDDATSARVSGLARSCDEIVFPWLARLKEGAETSRGVARNGTWRRAARLPLVKRMWRNSRRGFIMDIKSFLIGAMLVAVVLLGYLYYDSQRPQVKVDLPGVKIEGK